MVLHLLFCVIVVFCFYCQCQSETLKCATVSLQQCVKMYAVFFLEKKKRKETEKHSWSKTKIDSCVTLLCALKPPTYGVTTIFFFFTFVHSHRIAKLKKKEEKSSRFALL